jgi:hypothetical protein
MRAAAIGFESGFTGFIGLTITSLVWGEDYYYMVLSFQSLQPMRYAAARRMIKSNPLRITLTPKTKTSSVILEILKILIQTINAGIISFLN